MIKLKYTTIITPVMLLMVSGVLAEDAAAPATPPAAMTPAPPSATADSVKTDANTVPVTPAPAPAFQKPVVTPDTRIFRRTPVIDGIIQDGEWDAYYRFSGTGWEATAYMDWDDHNLYFAAKSSRPIDMQSLIDVNADGWFHGDDNFEIQTSGGLTGAMTVSVSKYESKNTKAPVASPVAPEIASMVEVKSSKSDTLYCIEMKIPAIMISGLRISSKKKIGLNININSGSDFGGWCPSQEIGDIQDCTLVTEKYASLKPVELSFGLRDDRVARGDEVGGKLYVNNRGDSDIDAKFVVLGGEGLASDILSSQKIRLAGIRAKDRTVQEIRSVIPIDMRLGYWALGAEVRSEGERLGSALASFEVVEPFDLELRLPGGPLKADTRELTFSVGVKSNCRDRIRGTATITLPQGWELDRNGATKDFVITIGHGATPIIFRAKPPIGASGEVPVKFSVTSRGRTLTEEGRIIIAPN